MFYQPGMGVGNLGSGFGVGGTDSPTGTVKGRHDPFASFFSNNNVWTPSKDEERDVDPPNSAHGIPQMPIKPETLEYINAEYAKHYGMDKATAYQEALSNTSYQRSVADMQKAGLNPAVIFGAGRGSGASSFSGHAVSTRRGSGGKAKEDDSFGLGDASGLIGSAVQLVTHMFTKNDGISSAAGNAAKSLAQTVDKLLSGKD